MPVRADEGGTVPTAKSCPSGRMRGGTVACCKELTPRPAFGHPLPVGEGMVFPFSLREKVPVRTDEGRIDFAAKT